MIVVYEWRAWDGYLVPTMFPRAARITARIGECAGDVVRQLPAAFTLFCFHVDLTHTSVVPIDRGALVQHLQALGIAVVNGSLTDISKRNVQSCCRACGLSTTEALREGDPDELLIVKTDLNYGGHPERQLDASERLIIGLPNQDGHERTSRTYPISRRRDVPPAAWERVELVVERFIANDAGLFFRAYVFLDRVVVSAGVVRDAVKELRWGVPRQDFYFDGKAAVPDPPQVYDFSSYCDRQEIVANLPPLRRFCRRIGLDFGAIDIVVDNDRRWYVVDANATPFWNRPDLDTIAQFLAAHRLTSAVAN
jgi:hypothetical protein